MPNRLRIWGSSLGMMLLTMLPASAYSKPPSATIADVQCLVVGARLASSPDQQQKLTGSMLAIYFLGRIDGRSPTVDLQELLKREAKKLTGSEFGSAASRCGAELSARGAEINRIGKTLEQLEK